MFDERRAEHLTHQVDLKQQCQQDSQTCTGGKGQSAKPIIVIIATTAETGQDSQPLEEQEDLLPLLRKTKIPLLCKAKLPLLRKAKIPLLCKAKLPLLRKAKIPH